MLARALFAPLAVLSLIAAPAMLADDGRPFGGFFSRKPEAMLVSIPGAPLPPMSPDAIRNAMIFMRPALAGLRLFGKSAALAREIGYMATLHAALGEDAEADRLFAEAEEMLRQLGVTGRDLGWVNNNHGLTRLSQHRDVEALLYFQAAVASFREETPEILEYRAKVEQNIGVTYEMLGDPENAEDHFWEALAVTRRLGKEDDPEFDVIRINLAEVYLSIHDFPAARKIFEPLAVEGRLHGTAKFAVLNNLSFAMNDTRGAESVLRRAMTLTRPESQERMAVHMNLAMTYFNAENFDAAQREAEEGLRLARQLDGEDTANAAAAMATLGATALARGDLDQAERLLSKAVAILSKTKVASDAVADLIQEMAIVAQRRGDRPRAVELSGRALRMKKENLVRILAFGSETQRLAYRSNLHPYDQLANLGDAALLADAVLVTKGAVLESLLLERAQARRSSSAVDRRRLDHIHALKVELMEKIGRGESHLDLLERELQKEETAMARSLKFGASSASAPVSLTSVQAALHNDEVLIEIIQYLRNDGDRMKVPCYGAIVIPHHGDASWVSLGPAEAIDLLVAGLLQRLDVGDRGMGVPSDVADVVPSLRELNDRVWHPLERALPAGARRTVLSPDGAMHFIPWAALLNEKERYLVERWQLAQVSSGRDLLHGTTAAAADNILLVLADGMNDLPSTRKEAKRLAEMAGANGWRTTVLAGDDALETVLTRAPAPRILHFATHGVQLGDKIEGPVGGRLGQHPMYRGALLLGGAKGTLAAWKRGSALPAADDGVLTAEEVAGLDLGRTWLTVLSACRSGSGEASIGEGVLGLRRGFALAGTENVVDSLWSIDDEATAYFMEEFYTRLFQTGDPARALNETQAAQLRRWTELDRDIPGAVFRAGGFVMSR
jgi:tetratricopeptide (TPR) repeat protein